MALVRHPGTAEPQLGISRVCRWMLLWWVNLGLGSVVFIRTRPKDGGVVDAELELGGPRTGGTLAL